jgi:type I restriction enzyme S subunit
MQPKGSLCITIAANIAECGFLSFDSCVPDSIVCLIAVDKSIENFVYHYLKLAKADLERFAPATAQKNINLGILNDLLIPFPPLTEQKNTSSPTNKPPINC